MFPQGLCLPPTKRCEVGILLVLHAQVMKPCAPAACEAERVL